MNLKYIKLIKVEPIHYGLKSEIEKEAILKAYQLFLKTCNFDIQILVQSKKENLSGHLTNIKKRIEKTEQEEIKEIAKKYMEFIQRLNQEKDFLTKAFYIVLKEERAGNEDEKIEEKIIKENLKEKYLKIKECLARCGNYAEEIIKKEEVQSILSSFFNIRNYLNQSQSKEVL